MTKGALMTTAQVAERLGVSVSTAQRLVRRSHLQPKVKVPGQTGAYLFERSEVERLAAQRAAA